MSLTDLIQPEAVLASLKARTRKQAIQELAERAAALSGLPVDRIVDAVRKREELGATGVGGGIAIPHAQVSGAKTIFAIFARADRPIDFGARDGAGVDLLCMLIAPELAGANHLKALSRVARVLHDPRLLTRLRGTKDAATIYHLLASSADSRAA